MARDARTSTKVLSAFVQPTAERYLRRLTQRNFLGQQLALTMVLLSSTLASWR